MTGTNSVTRLAMIRAMQKTREQNVRSFLSGPGYGLSVEQMAEILERESGYQELYEALEAVLQFSARAAAGLVVDAAVLSQKPLLNDPAFKKAQLALAKARGESQ